MTGPEHYRQAEKLADEALEWLGGDQGDGLTRDEQLAMVHLDLTMGQLHAMLAAVAAIVGTWTPLELWK